MPALMLDLYDSSLGRLCGAARLLEVNFHLGQLLLADLYLLTGLDPLRLLQTLGRRGLFEVLAKSLDSPH